MALGPKDLNKWTAEDEQAVDMMEKSIDQLLAKINPSPKEGVYRLVLQRTKFQVELSNKANQRLGALLNRYRTAGWGEVDGGIMGDGSICITLREHKRYYSNPF